MKTIDSYIKDHNTEQLDFIIAMCNLNSHSYNKRGTDGVASLIIPELIPILEFYESEKQEKLGDHHIFRNHKSGKAIYLIGHLDTVFPPNHGFQACRVENDRLYGPGTCDMKGGIGVIVYALKALHEIGALDNLNIAVILNGDEEIGSITSRSLFERERENAIACLVAETAGPDGEIVVSRNGKIGARIDSYGADRHVSDVAKKKNSAVLELCHQVIALEAFNDYLPGARINVGRIEGGLGPSTVARHATALVDVRWVNEEHRPILEDLINKSLSGNSRPGCNTTFTVLNSRPAMPLNGSTEKLFEKVRAIAGDLGQNTGSEHRRGTSDANFFGTAGIPTLDGLGPLGRDDHTENEHIEIKSIEERTRLLANILIEMGKRTIII